MTVPHRLYVFVASDTTYFHKWSQYPATLVFQGKVINIFQTTSMGHKGHVDAKAVYASTGVPSPEEIQHFLRTLLNGSVPRLP